MIFQANRYNCPPGLAYDQVTRGCKWADQVPECASPVVVVDEEGGEFQCPQDSTAGTFTKHPHPADCRLFFLCMNGQVRLLASDWSRLITCVEYWPLIG